MNAVIVVIHVRRLAAAGRCVPPLRFVSKRYLQLDLVVESAITVDCSS